MIQFHYAVQVCDVSSNQGLPRHCGNDRSELTEKSLTSLLESIKYLIEQQNETKHTVCLFDDHSSQRVKDFISRLKNKYSDHNIIIEHVTLQEKGLISSLRSCWEYLRDFGVDFVYQIQDDYLFERSAVYEMSSIFFQLLNDCNTHAVVTPCNDPHLWYGTYRYRQTPRTIVLGESRYWIQMYDTPCTFFTSKEQFVNNWDLIEKFLSFDPRDPKIEVDSVNKMFVERGVLGIGPINTLTHHVQTELDKDPFIDYRLVWDSLPKI